MYVKYLTFDVALEITWLRVVLSKYQIFSILKNHINFRGSNFKVNKNNYLSLYFKNLKVGEGIERFRMERISILQGLSFSVTGSPGPCVQEA